MTTAPAASSASLPASLPDACAAPALPEDTRIAFIGGGNMASAIMGGLIAQGLPASRISVVDPLADTRDRLHSSLGVQVHAEAGDFLAGQDVLVWAVKPQVFQSAAPAVAPYAQAALHLSVMAGIRCQSLADATQARRIVRCMPNTPALIGQGMTGLFAPQPLARDCALAEALIGPTGQSLWVDREELLDAVTALSGSGPAYVFYFLEAMQAAGTRMGLSAGQARQLATATFIGSARLAAASPDPLPTLRERVTSKGGTTFAALEVMRAAQMEQHFIQAMQAAQRRADELGREAG